MAQPTNRWCRTTKGDHRVTESLKPVGFWSYAQTDDQIPSGQLGMLREMLGRELQLQIGQPTRIFQSTTANEIGSDGRHEIVAAIAEASFFVAILTPSYLQSQFCAQELLWFREREAALGRNDLIFPLHYIDTSQLALTTPQESNGLDVLALLRSRQMADFRDLRSSTFDTGAVWSRIAALARSIRVSLTRTVLSEYFDKTLKSEYLRDIFEAGRAP